jgi:AraC-like DNA-binding protein
MNLHIEQRTVAQSGMEAVPRIGPEPNDRINSAPATSGRYNVFGIRPGLNLSVFDVLVGPAMGSQVRSEPCFAINVLFEATGQGWLMPPDGGEGVSIPYRSGRLYLFFAGAGAAGRYDVPVGTRLRGIDIRLSLDFLDRLGVRGLFEKLSGDHPLHAASAAGCWIGMLPLPPALGVEAKVLLDTGLAKADDLVLEARCLDIIGVVIAMLRDPRPRHPARDRRKIEQARDLMLADLARPWTIGELARRIGLTEKRLKSGFREEFGKPVYRYLQEARLTEAGRLLAEPRARVTDVSLAVGYSSTSHFTRLFTREFGFSPSSLRYEKASREQ